MYASLASRSVFGDTMSFDLDENDRRMLNIPLQLL